jgi:hypothetical protein
MCHGCRREGKSHITGRAYNRGGQALTSDRIDDSLEFDADGGDVDQEMNLNAACQASATEYMYQPTEKTMRKNGRKWSNISVKKYHHKPGFGVRSGSVSLQGELEQSKPHQSEID